MLKMDTVQGYIHVWHEVTMILKDDPTASVLMFNVFLPRFECVVSTAALHLTSWEKDKRGSAMGGGGLEVLTAYKYRPVF